MKLNYLITIIFLFLISCKPNSGDTKNVTISIEEDSLKNGMDTDIVEETPKTEYKPSSSFDHIAHLRNNSRPKEFERGKDEPMYFVDYVIKYLLENPSDRQYITDRKLLNKLTVVKCDDEHVLINDTLMDGTYCEIKLNTVDFNEEQFKVDYRDENTINTINGKLPYGAFYGTIKKSIGSINVKIGNKEYTIGHDKLPSINNTWNCKGNILANGIEFYEDDGIIFIYVVGGNAANTYFGKLVIDRNGYITSIISDYIPLSKYGSFTIAFKGF